MIQSFNQSKPASGQLGAFPVKGKALQIMDFIRNDIQSGTFPAGAKLPTERELAAKFSVSLQTVNKAMSRLEDEGLLRRSTGSGTFVSASACQKAIAVICDRNHLAKEEHSPFYDLLIDNLVAAAKEKRFLPHSMLGSGCSADEFAESLQFDSPVWRSIGGAIQMAWRKDFEERLLLKGIPLVTISTEQQGKHTVILDYFALGNIAAKWLIGKGCRGIGVIYNRKFDGEGYNDPLAGFNSAVRKTGNSGIEVKTAAYSAVTLDAGCAAMDRLFAGGAHYDALFVDDDNVASGVAQWLEKHSRSKDDLVVVSHATTKVTTWLPESFFLCAFDMNELCRSAAACLGELMSGSRTVRRKIHIKPKMIEGVKRFSDGNRS